MYYLEIQQAIRISRIHRQGQPGDFQRVVVTLRVCCNRVPASDGKSIEFCVLEQILEKILKELDGQRLLDLDVFADKTPSLEHVAEFIFNKSFILLSHTSVKPDEVTLEIPQGFRVSYRK